MINEKYIIDLRTYIQQKTGILYFKNVRQTTDNLIVTCPYHKEGQENKPSASIRTNSNNNVSEGLLHCFTCGKSAMLPQVVEDLLGNLYDANEVNTLFNLQDLTIQAVFKDDNSSVKFTIPKELNYESNLLKRYNYYHEYLVKRRIDESTAVKYSIGFDEINNQITFPIRDINRYCIGIGRRSIDKKFYSYPEGMIKPLYRCI